jgi:hypothetical protein
MHGGASRAFERWLKFAQDGKKLRAKSKTVIYRIMNMHVARCFGRWTDRLRTMKKVKKCMSILLKKSMVCCFYAWQERSVEKKETGKRLQTAARKILGKWMHGGASRAFERWLKFAQDGKKLRAKSKTVIYRIMNMHVARCFSIWISFLVDAKSSAFQVARRDLLTLKQKHWFYRLRILILGIHFHFFRRYFKTRRSLNFRLLHKGLVTRRRHFSSWFSFLSAVKVQRDDEFTVSVLKSVSNVPLQYHLEEHATKRIHSSRAIFCKSFEKQLESLQAQARPFATSFFSQCVCVRRGYLHFSVGFRSRRCNLGLSFNAGNVPIESRGT